ncbi:MAG: multicopper oxidase family protein [Gemmatimonadales bacterium]|nr:multicopper oxidase family protein [Gemmatimonadales bacterium]NCG31810.1 multicopper oxidase domain-containing protein [Pseudomonadota bacterium]MBT3775492.1 multicopper oxidase family protein [Gemmatimonadales bacterium]MBT4436975.1 multicopper oxidase family protein [Gemmatimonadales bacterium]MBT4914789.1 multicopper oxidase family protein [Gemmatimonadales bacterium]
MNWRATMWLLALLIATVPAPIAAQHDMRGMTMDGGWRMVPMDPNMPMLPGLENAVPIVGPFMPGMGMDPAMLPEARPSELVPMASGDTLDISVSMVRRTLNGHEMIMFGYNGQYPGPLIQAEKDATIIVRVTNEIEMPTTIHWHGIRIDNRFDGVPGVTQSAIERGESFTYEVHVPDAGMFWYHPHVREDVQQDLGLFGNLLVTSPDPDYYGPAHREEVFVLDDMLMDDQGAIPWGDSAPTHALMGRFGNVMMVNGETDYRLDAKKGEVVRFYLTNVANTRTFNVTFGGNPVKIVASDVGRYEREQWIPSVVIAPAERYVVDVRFDDPGEVAISNTIQAIDHFRGTFYPHVDTLSIVTVSDEAADPAISEAFEELREHDDVVADIDRFRQYFGRAPDHELETTVRIQDLPNSIVIQMESDTLFFPPIEWNDGMPMMNWLSTGEQVTWILKDRKTGAENGDIHWNFSVGDVVKIRVFNTPDSFHPMNHPIHIHGQRFLVLNKDGVESDNLVWKDTAIVPVGSTMDFLVEMSNPGEWMVHCHIAEHLHAGMMFSFTVEAS